MGLSDGVWGLEVTGRCFIVNAEVYRIVKPRLKDSLGIRQVFVSRHWIWEALLLKLKRFVLLGALLPDARCHILKIFWVSAN